MADDIKKTEPIKENAISPAAKTIPVTIERSTVGEIDASGEMLEGHISDEQMKRLNEAYKKVLKDTTLPIKKALESLSEMLNNILSQNAGDLLQAVNEIIGEALKLINEITELKPYLEKELEKEGYGFTFADLMGKTPGELQDMLDEPGSLLLQALEAARAAAADKEPERATIKRAQTVEYPLDKPNSILWELLEKDTNGQIEFNMASTEDQRLGLSFPAYYSINFDDLGGEMQITKRLLPFDKLAYIATGALFNAGNNIITLQQIYYAMGYTGTPGDNDREKIYKSITKMRTADIYFDNQQESAKYKYSRFRYEGALLPCEIGEAVINGKKTDKAIHVFREPPLITFAKQRHQITTLDIKLLQAPVSKTDANLRIQDYLLERISKAKNGKHKHKRHSHRILLKTLYENAGITTKKQIQRAPEKIEKYLKHYQQQKFISRYTLQNDGITIYW